MSDAETTDRQTVTLQQPGTGRSGVRSVARRMCQFGPLLGLVVVFILFCILCRLRDAPFHSFYNLKTIVTQTVIVGIGALGMTLIIISGCIDLSVGSLIALTTVIVAVCLRHYGPAVSSVPTIVTRLLLAAAICQLAAGLFVRNTCRRRQVCSSLVPCLFVGAAAFLLCASVSAWMPPSILAPCCAVALGVGAAALCGWVSGVVISKLGIVSFIATLGMMQIVRGLAKWLGREQTVVAPETWLNSLMLVDPEPEWLILAPGVWLMLMLLVVLQFVLKCTVFGRYVYAIGSSEATARLCGISVEFYRIVIFVLAAVFTGIAGVMQFANLTVGDPTAAVGMELDIIAAVVIGGGSLNGGEGTAVGTLVGALIMAVLRNGCNMLGVPNYVQNIIIGSVIIGAVAVDSLKHRMRE